MALSLGDSCQNKVHLGYVSAAECIEDSAFSGVICVTNQNITDLTGIEAFVNITNLNLSNNNLS